MNSTHRKTLEILFAQPVPRSLTYRNVERLLVALGCELGEGAGSRVRFLPPRGGLPLYLHRPHPGKELKPYQVASVRAFLESMGVTP